MVNILIVEDDERTLQLCTDTLLGLEEGISPIPVASAEAALEELGKNRIDGAFIDIILPGMDGFSLASRIRGMDEYYYLPIIFATGQKRDMPETYKQYRNIDYIAKPCEMHEFRPFALRLLKEVEKQRSLSASKEPRKIPILYDEGRALILFSEILYASTYPDRKIRLATRTHEYIRSNITLGNLITEINEEMFVQCHKAYVVNVENIERIERFSRKAWTIYFKDAPDEKCEMSQKYKDEVEKWLKGIQGSRGGAQVGPSER